MGTACHIRHHNTCPIAFRTQDITARKNMIAAPKPASQLFCKREEVIFGQAKVPEYKIQTHKTKLALFKATIYCGCEITVTYA